jgi:predicted O-methyltransferase YrrM
MNKYDLSHLNQSPSQNVFGPIQDDEALFLYSIIRGMRLKNVLEIGFGNGYSAKNFLSAVGEDGLVISVDNDNSLLYKIQENHIVICKDASLLDPKDLTLDKIDLIFFDCHNFNAQISLFNRLINCKLINDDTVLVLHDTNTWKENYNGCAYRTEQGWVHQKAEREMVNYFFSIGYSPFCLHTKPEAHNENFPFRHGVTVMKKFNALSI